MGGVEETQTTQVVECQSESRGGHSFTQGGAVGRSESADGSTGVCAQEMERELLSTGWAKATFQAGESAREKALEAENILLKAQVGALVMDNDLLSAKIDRLEDGVPLHWRKSKC